MNREIRQFLNHHLGAVDVRFAPIKKGGSDRSFFRLQLPGSKSFVFMNYGTEVEENAYWVEINRFMNDIGIPVPRIIAFDFRQRFLLLEDLGSEDLYLLRGQPWHRRRHYYLMALSEIHRLHRFDLSQLPAGLKLTKGYDRSLYLWEHDYFRENLVEAVCKLDLSGDLARDLTQELDALANRLLAMKPCLIHRDFQSQNIMIRNDRPVFVDFQGMREGNLFYDLGSLICDPYVTLSPDERNELIAFYYRISQPHYPLDDFTDYFWEGAAQRLMQALGAYGFLGLKKNKRDFLQHIPNGLKNLIAAASKSGNLPALNELAKNCLAKISSAPQDTALTTT